MSSELATWDLVAFAIEIVMAFGVGMFCGAVWMVAWLVWPRDEEDERTLGARRRK